MKDRILKLKDWMVYLFWYQLRGFILGCFGFKIEIKKYPNPLLKWPVNNLCFCGSKRKAKKCCLPEMPRYLDHSRYSVAINALERNGIKL